MAYNRLDTNPTNNATVENAPSGAGSYSAADTLQVASAPDTIRELMADIAQLVRATAGSTVLTTTGTADAQVVTIPGGALDYNNDFGFWCVFHLTNTGPMTMDVNGLGVKSLLDKGGVAISASQILINTLHHVRYIASSDDFRIGQLA